MLTPSASPLAEAGTGSQADEECQPRRVVPSEVHGHLSFHPEALDRRVELCLAQGVFRPDVLLTNLGRLPEGHAKSRDQWSLMRSLAARSSFWQANNGSPASALSGPTWQPIANKGTIIVYL